MFRKFFKGSSSNKVKRKKRISPTVGPGITTTGTVEVSAPTPGYQYALNEFQQTIPAHLNNDDGSSVGYPTSSSIHEKASRAHDAASAAGYVEAPDHADPWNDQDVTQRRSNTMSSPTPESSDPPSLQPQFTNSTEGDETQYPRRTPFSPTSLESVSSYPYHPRQPFPVSRNIMPDAAYEEWYGDAYLGGPIKYIYPNGYQSMRPRGGPWRLSLVICILFTWLSIFIIGHCSDRVDQTLYDDEFDDDQLMIETKWCGSRLLYMMWVVSMLITGLASAYCGVIGYIKIRDFAVANTRSQPPGLVGSSDYYVTGTGHGTIYQSDGNPQFWGSHIYRPTQAAVAITSR